VLAESVSADCRVSHAGRPVTSSTPTDQPHRKPPGKRTPPLVRTAEAFVDQQIGDDAVTRRRRLDGRRRAGTAALDHVDSCTADSASSERRERRFSIAPYLFIVRALPSESLRP